MNRLSTPERAAIVSALVEGNSIRATCRITGRDKETVMRLLAHIGVACDVYQGGALRNIPCKRVECDEIWSFVGAKAKNVPEQRQDEYGIGDVYTWVALDPDTKLVVTWRVGQRSAQDAERFMRDLASRVAGRIQITTDGYSRTLPPSFLPSASTPLTSPSSSRNTAEARATSTGTALPIS